MQPTLRVAQGFLITAVASTALSFALSTLFSLRTGQALSNLLASSTVTLDWQVYQRVQNQLSQSYGIWGDPFGYILSELLIAVLCATAVANFTAFAKR